MAKISTRTSLIKGANWGLLLVVLGLVVLSIISTSSNMLRATTPGGPITGIADLCLTNQASRTVNGNRIQVEDCNAGSSQLWTWTGDTTIRVQGMCLDVQSSGTAPGTPVQLWTCNGTNSQKWRPQADGSIRNLNANLCLETVNGGSINGTGVWLNLCDTARIPQRWNLSQAVIPLPVVQPAPHAPLPPTTPITPIPLITLDASQAPEFLPWLDQVAKPEIERWYPVLADFYAYPHHTVMNSFTIKMDPTEGVAAARGSLRLITLNPDYFRAHPSDMGAVIHEATHLIQYSSERHTRGMPGWIVEGMADYSREHIYRDRAPRVPVGNETFFSGYSPASNVLASAQAANSNFLKLLSAYAWEGNYSDSLFTQLSGRNIAQHWLHLTSQTINNPGTFVNKATGYCLTMPLSDPDEGLPPTLRYCNPLSLQKWIFNAPPTSTTGIIVGENNGRCLSTLGNGTANSTSVVYASCNSSANPGQLWKPTGYPTSFVNPRSGKCLQPVDGVALNTQLEIQTCNGTSLQQWSIPTIYRKFFVTL